MDNSKSIMECIEVAETALWSCANTVALTRDADDALAMSEACERMASTLESLFNIKKSVESEEK